jgi:mannosyltransferase
VQRVIELLKNKSSSLSLALIAGLGGALRLYNLGAKSVWCDEAITIFVARQGPSSLLNDYTHSTPGSLAGDLFQHDITTALLLHPITLLSFGEFYMRLLPAIAGVLSIVFIYCLGRSLDARVGLLSAFILAISPYNIWYSQTARPFIFSVLFTLISLYFFLQALERNRGWHWSVYVLSTALNIYTFQFGLFVLIAENLYVLLWHKQYRRVLRRWFLSQGMIFLFLLPILGIFISQAARRTVRTGLPTGLSLAISYGSPWYAFTLGSLFPKPAYLLVALPGLMATGFLVLRGLWSQRQQKASLSFLSLYLLVPYLLSLPVRLTMDVIPLARSLIMISPAYYILIGLGILSFRNTRLRAGSLLFLIALSVFCLHDYYTTDIYQGLKLGANYIREHTRKGDVILHLEGGDPLTFEYYIRGQVPAYRAWGSELEEVKNGVAEGKVERVWVVAYRWLSTTQQMTATSKEEVSGEQEFQLVDALLRQVGLTRVAETAFPGENKLILGLYKKG